MNKIRCFISLFTVSFFLFVSCEKNNLDTFFLVVDEKNLKECVDVQTLNQDHESSFDHTLDIYELETAKSQSFKNVHIIINDKDERGYWELPCKIPILATGKVKLQIFPAIEVNGNSTHLARYIFMTPFIKEITAEKGGIITLNADDISFKYAPGKLNFPLIESFQQSTSFVRRETESDSAATINIIYDSHKQDYVGLIKLNKDTSFFDIVSKDLTFKAGGGDARIMYLQLDYKMDYQLEDDAEIDLPVLSIEVRYTNGSNQKCHDPLVLFRYTNEWKSVYINIGSVIGMAGALDYVIRDFVVNLTGYLPEGCKSVNFFLDNVKIVTEDE